MRLAVPKETAPNETRAVLVPQCVGRLVKAGMEVVVQASAGEAAGCSDDDYRSKGARIESDADKLFGEADVLLKVQPPRGTDGGHELDRCREGTILIGQLGALGGLEDRALLEKLERKRITALSMDCVPRITRAQSMDILSSMSTIAGYKCVLIAANELSKMMPMLMTAAGTLSAARVFVLGAGVAGLQAIATAKRLGAVVEAFDTRAAVKEQVQSLGGRFVEMDMSDAEGAGGYAKELSEEQHKKEQELLARHVQRADCVITTALVPGRKAPEIVTEEMVKSMRAGSVVVDLAAERGGNCAVTEAGKTVVKHGVTICGPLNLPATLPVHASQMFSRNVSTFLEEFWTEGELVLNAEDEIIAAALVTRNGECVHEPTKQRMATEGVN